MDEEELELVERPRKRARGGGGRGRGRSRGKSRGGAGGGRGRRPLRVSAPSRQQPAELPLDQAEAVAASLLLDGGTLQPGPEEEEGAAATPGSSLPAPRLRRGAGRTGMRQDESVGDAWFGVNEKQHRGATMWRPTFGGEHSRRRADMALQRHEFLWPCRPCALGCPSSCLRGAGRSVFCLLASCTKLATHWANSSTGREPSQQLASRPQGHRRPRGTIQPLACRSK